MRAHRPARLRLVLAHTTHAALASSSGTVTELAGGAVEARRLGTQRLVLAGGAGRTLRRAGSAPPPRLALVARCCASRELACHTPLAPVPAFCPREPASLARRAARRTGAADLAHRAGSAHTIAR